MPKPFLLLQLSDPHLDATWGEGDSLERLARTVECIRGLPDAPDAILVTGDLADDGGEAGYAALSEMLDPLGVPVYALPGNHDDRETLRRHFRLPGEPDAPVNYTVDVGPLRVVLLDSTRPGHDGGELDAPRLSWLDLELSDAPDRPTILAMHHPPLRTAAPAWDRIGLTDADLASLAGVLDRHSQVRLVVGGHLHRTIVSRLSDRTVLAAPAVHETAEPDFTGEELKLAGGPPAFVLHVLTENGELSSHVQVV